MDAVNPWSTIDKALGLDCPAPAETYSSSPHLYVELDIPAGKLELLVSESELAERRRAWQAPAPKYTRGYLARYARMATSAATGAILKWD